MATHINSPASNPATATAPVATAGSAAAANSSALPTSTASTLSSAASDKPTEGFFAKIKSALTAMKDGIIWGAKTAIYYLSCKTLCKSVAPAQPPATENK